MKGQIMSKKVYAVTICWYRRDENGELRLHDTGVSTLAYDSLDKAQLFLASRCSKIAESGWRGSIGTNVGESIYEIRELTVEKG
jgi:hypothetical protein